MYINPQLVSIYDTGYLVTALKKPTIPKWLKEKWLKEIVLQELGRRGITLSSSAPTKPADIIASPFKIERIDDFAVVCYNSIEAYITFSTRCPEY